MVRELGLERREAVWSLSTVNKIKKGFYSSTRGMKKSSQWFKFIFKSMTYGYTAN